MKKKIPMQMSQLSLWYHKTITTVITEVQLKKTSPMFTPRECGENRLCCAYIRSLQSKKNT